MEPLITTYRDVNIHQIEIIGQTEASVKTNNKTMKLPLLITKETTSPLMGLDWMERLGIHINTINSEIQIHNVKMDDTERKTAQQKNEFKDLFYNNKEIKDLSIK